jgi:hypothetical protein
VWLISVAVALLAFCTFADVAFAGDTDGVTGYSMRLKDKNFDAGDGSGETLLVDVDDNVQISVVKQLGHPKEAVRPRTMFMIEWHWFLALVGLR